MKGYSARQRGCGHVVCNAPLTILKDLSAQICEWFVYKFFTSLNPVGYMNLYISCTYTHHKQESLRYRFVVPNTDVSLTITVLEQSTQDLVVRGNLARFAQFKCVTSGLLPCDTCR